MSNHIWIHPPTRNAICEGIMSVFKLLTKDVLVKNTQLDGFQESFTIQLEGATKVQILNERKINLMSKHLRTKDTHVKLSIMCDHSLRARSNECHQVRENLNKWTTPRLCHLFSDS